MEILSMIGAMVLCGGFVATVIFTWINVVDSVAVDKRVAKLDTQRYELEKRICELEEWRNS